MKRGLLACVLLVAVGAYAQHGRPSGPPPSAGGAMSPGSSNAGSRGMGAGEAHGMGTPDTRGPSSTSISKQSPDTILGRNTKLSSKLETMLPKGTTAQQACSGFKNLGQCVAAIHVSHNLGISFDDLKAKMMGGDSLGKATTELKPEANAKDEEKRAKKQADADLKGSGD